MSRHPRSADAVRMAPPADAGDQPRRPALPTRTRSRALNLLAALAVTAAFVVAKTIVLPIILAFLVGLLFRPVVRWLERHRVPASVGAAIIMLTLVAAAGWLAVMLAGPLTEWLQRLPEAAHRARSWFEQVRGPLDDLGDAAKRMEEAASFGDDSWRSVQIRDGGWWSAILGGTRELLAGAMIAAVACYFLLACGSPLMRRLIGMLPSLQNSSNYQDMILGVRIEETAEEVLHEIESQVSAYLGTITAINVVLGIATGLLAWAAGLPDPLLWGVLACACNYIPYLGPCSVLLVLALVSFTTHPEPLRAAIAPVGYMLLIAVEGNAITPYIIGRHFSMNPLIIFLWMVLVTWLWGIPGAFLALPILILVRILSSRIRALGWVRVVIDP